MVVHLKLASTFVVIALAASPVFADKKKSGHGHDNGKVEWKCPPGLAKKNPPCVPPGQAKKHHKKHSHHHHEVGDRLDLSEYIRIDDPRRYGYPVQDGWNYYRDPYGVYRVDPATRKILAVFELIEAFAN